MKPEKGNNNIDDAHCRLYWQEQTEQAYNFLQEILVYPVEECGEKMVSLRQAVKGARLTVIFSSDKIAGKFEKIYFLREGLINNFLAAAKEINNRGWFIKVEDAYRTPTMQQYIVMQNPIFDAILRKVIWENDGIIPSPEMMSRRLSAFVADCPGNSAHTSGSALDLSICSAGSLSELDCGGKYQKVSENTFTDSPFISAKACKNRLAVRDIMQKHGFIISPYDFWHFNSGNADAEKLLNSGKPARYGSINFNPANDSISAVKNLTTVLNPPATIQAKMESSLKRLKLKL